MAEKFHGRTYSTPEEMGLPPLSDEELAEAKKAFAEFDALRASVPQEERTVLADRFGAHDFDWHEDDDNDPNESDTPEDGAHE